MRISIKRSTLVLIVLAVLGLLLGALGIYKYQQISKELSQLRTKIVSGADTSEDKKKQMLADVEKIAYFPPGETPIIALVSDVSKLKNQGFYIDAKDGDWVFVFNKAQRAVLYRPSIKRIIQASPVTVATATETQQATGAGSVATTPKSIVSTTSHPTVLLRNATNIVGLTKKYEKELTQKVPLATVVNKENAKRTDLPKTFIVSVDPTAGEQVKSLAQTLGIDVGSLPAGESSKSSDATMSAAFIIFVGLDKK